MICLCGPNSLLVKRQIFVTQQAQIVCKVYENHSVSAHAVSIYKHLGNYATPDFKSNAHIQHRVSEGTSALVPLSRHVIFSKHLLLNTRTLLASALIFSKLYYNLHIWYLFSEVQMHHLTVFHMKVCRKLYGFDHLHPVSDDLIQSHIRILPPAYHIRRSRLLYLGRLFVHGPPRTPWGHHR